MTTQHINLVLTGGRAGKTCTLGKHHFVKGKGVVPMIGGVLRFMAIAYAAFPEGSPELAAAQERDNGNADIPESAGSGQAEPVPSDVPTDGTASSEPTAVSDGTDDGGDASQEHDSERDGQKDVRIREAVSQLDVHNDDHWTHAGKPAVHPVSELLNEPISRADLDAAAPDLTREKD